MYKHKYTWYFPAFFDSDNNTFLVNFPCQYKLSFHIQEWQKDREETWGSH